VHVRRLNLFSAATSVAAALLLSACSDSSSGPPPTPTNVTPVDLSTAGAVAVRVDYRGPVPPPKPINMSGVPGCATLHQEPVYDQRLVVADGHLANAVVYIKSGLGDRAFAPPREPVIIDQNGCVYLPSVAAVMVGQALQFRNSDPEAHNVHGRPGVVPGWNFTMTARGSTRDMYFDRPEIGIPVGCDIHPWMRAFVSVFANPYFAVTPADGRVTLQPLPPGDYVVATWHATLGNLEQPVTVPARGTAEVQFSYPAPAS
jgi:plastocyanin